MYCLGDQKLLWFRCTELPEPPFRLQHKASLHAKQHGGVIFLRFQRELHYSQYIKAGCPSTMRTPSTRLNMLFFRRVLQQSEAWQRAITSNTLVREMGLTLTRIHMIDDKTWILASKNDLNAGIISTLAFDKALSAPAPSMRQIYGRLYARYSCWNASGLLLTTICRQISQSTLRLHSTLTTNIFFSRCFPSLHHTSFSTCNSNTFSLF